MRDRTFQTVAILAAVALIGTVTVSVVASGGARAQDSGFLGHLPRWWDNTCMAAVVSMTPWPSWSRH